MCTRSSRDSETSTPSWRKFSSSSNITVNEDTSAYQTPYEYLVYKTYKTIADKLSAHLSRSTVSTEPNFWDGMRMDFCILGSGGRLSSETFRSIDAIPRILL
ncbi:uncharacterized protein EAE97_011851 [Botrytis byssoidea]|uniref:Uncharacterized protein n=1 Tax=Botrytis byssoidea TaxID=139641 RepID=A0A9P5LPP7_9HELO|nr:uncharacterized protein EAE97_011851 [Botrytis byssoidea]KAF7918756.1 hypothetical protein EAE97_011851 [Botrytis byssoidea]